MAENDEDRLLIEALAAQDVSSPPADFAARVLAAAERAGTVRAGTDALGAEGRDGRGGRSARVVRTRWLVAAAAAAVLGAGGAWAYARREVRGELVREGDASGPASAQLGARARVVLEPGTRLSYRVGGVLPGHTDVVDLTRGTAFFRVDGGGSFEVRTPHGTVQVTGTCFRVAVGDEQGASEMDRMTRLRWFGAGALSATLAVVVYEGGVNLAAARSRDRVHLAPGEAASVTRDGAVARAHESAPAPAASLRAEPATTSGTPGVSARAEAASPAEARELVRLREILAANGISPETGRPVAAATAGTTGSTSGDGGPAHPGLSDPGNTDLTPDEWRTLAERGELRYALPGLGHMGTPGSVVRSSTADALRIPEEDVRQIDEAVHRAQERLLTELRALYREASNLEPGNLSFQALESEIRDKTPPDTVSQVNWQLSQERGGLVPAQPPRPEMSPYERMMRLLIGFEAQLEQDLTAIVGAQTAHALLHGDNAISSHSYGMRGRPASTN